MKKIRFPLLMENGVEARTLDELRNNFSVVSVTEYIKSGKMITWLEDRFENELAENIKLLDTKDEEYVQKLCKIFRINYNAEFEQQIQLVIDVMDKRKKLMEYTDDEEILKHASQVAFVQDDLFALLDNGERTIYLCGDKFSIPLGVSDITYIGVNSPTIVVNSDVLVDWSKKKIVLENIVFDDEYQKAIKKQQEVYYAQKEYYIEKRQVIEEDILGISEGNIKDIDSLIEVNIITKEEKIIETYVEDYFNDGEKIYIIQVLFSGYGFTKRELIVFSPQNDTKYTVPIELPIEIRPIGMIKNFGTRIFPKERNILVNGKKVVYKKNFSAYVADIDGKNNIKLSVCGSSVTLVCLYEDDLYYINIGNKNNRCLYRYNLFDRTNNKLADDVNIILYTDEKLYYEELSTTSAVNIYGWQVCEINLSEQKEEIIYIPNDMEDCSRKMIIEDNKLLVQGLYSDDFYIIKELDKVK